MNYSEKYWNNYFDGKYEDTYRSGFCLNYDIEKSYYPYFGEYPKSIADIGCGPGYTLKDIKTQFPDAYVYGVEIQRIPKQLVVDPNVIFGDYLEIYKSLTLVDLLYVSCSMYVSWEKQETFLKICCKHAKKAVCFANLYLEEEGIPTDYLRKVVYRNRSGFEQAMNSLGYIKPYPQIKYSDFFVPSSK